MYNCTFITTKKTVWTSGRSLKLDKSITKDGATIQYTATKAIEMGKGDLKIHNNNIILVQN